MADVRPSPQPDSAPTISADGTSGTGILRTLFRSELGGHEQVVLCQDRASGLKAVIALHSPALGPGLGGTRFHPYAGARP